MTNIAILASHNGSGFSALYDAKSNNILDINIPLVVSNNTNAGVLEKANSFNIENHIVNGKLYENPDKAIYELLKEKDCKYIFLSGYMKKISSLLTDNFKIINCHPSLLPSYGGVGMYGRYVHEAVIANKERYSGVTIHYVNENYDEGEIILQKSIEILSGDSAESLEIKIKELEQKAIVEAFAKLLSSSQ